MAKRKDDHKGQEGDSRPQKKRRKESKEAEAKSPGRRDQAHGAGKVVANVEGGSVKAKAGATNGKGKGMSDKSKAQGTPTQQPSAKGGQSPLPANDKRAPANNKLATANNKLAPAKAKLAPAKDKLAPAKAKTAPAKEGHSPAKAKKTKESADREGDGDRSKGKAKGKASAASVPAEEEMLPRGGSAPKAAMGGGAGRPTEAGRRTDDMDVLFGSSEKKQRSTTEAGQAKRRSKGDEKGKGKGKKQQEPKEREAHAEQLKFKRLSVGMVLLGAVKEINVTDIAVSLPNGLTGFVKLNHISEPLSALISAGAAEEREEEDVEGEEGEGRGEGEVPALHDIVRVGQFVRCAITQLSTTPGNKRVELSLEPTLINAGLVLQAVQEGMVLWGCIKSVEDHGYTVSFGVPFTGVLLNKHVARPSESGSAPRLHVGQPVECFVLSVNVPARTIAVSLLQDQVSTATLKESAHISLETLKAGSVVQARVAGLLPNGLSISFLGLFTATVAMPHLLDPLVPPDQLATKYHVNQKVKARILYVDKDSKRIDASLRPPLVSGAGFSFLPDVSVGSVVDAAVIRRIDPGVGMFLELPSDGGPCPAYVHISAVSDEHIDKLEKHFRVGAAVRCRVTGTNFLDGILNVSLRPSVIDSPILRYEDVHPGMALQGQVIAVEDAGVFVALTENVKGFCPRGQLAEVRLKKPSAKFKPGAAVKCRVLSTKPEARRIVVTFKKSLVESDLAPLVSFDDAKPGMIVDGQIAAAKDNGCLVQFYNKIHGFVPLSELGVPVKGFGGGTGDTATDDRPMVGEAFQTGQVVRCRVLTCDSQTHKLRLSFVLEPKHKGRDTERTHRDKGEGQAQVQGTVSAARVAVSPGDIVRGVLFTPSKSASASASAPAEDKALLVRLEGGLVAILPEAQLADVPGFCKAMRDRITAKEAELGDLLVLSVVDDPNHPRPRVVVSRKPSLLEAARSASLPATVDALQVNTVYAGYVKNITSFGVFVTFLSDVTGLAHRDNLGDIGSDSLESVFSVGQSVLALVTHIDPESSKVALSLKQDVCGTLPVQYLETVLQFDEDLAAQDGEASSIDWDQFAFGSLVEGTVQVVKEFGVVVRLEHDLTGFVHASHITKGHEYNAGERVRAFVLDVSKIKRIVDLSLARPLLRPKGVHQRTSSEGQEDDTAAPVDATATTVTLTPGLHTTAAVQLVKEEYMALTLPAAANAVAFATFNSTNLRLKDPHLVYHRGQNVKATVYKLDGPGGRVLLDIQPIRPAPSVEKTPKKQQPRKSESEGTALNPDVSSMDDLKPGMRVKAKVEAIARDQMAAHVSLGSGMKGMIHITEVHELPSLDSLSSYGGVGVTLPFINLKPGQVVNAKVVAVASNSDCGTRKSSGKVAQLTIKKADLQLPDDQAMSERVTIDSLAAGDSVMGVVTQVSRQSATISLSCVAKARLFVTDASESPSATDDLQKTLHVGEVVRCLVREVRAGQHIDVSLTDKGSGLEEGQVVFGVVHSALPGGRGLKIQLGVHRFGEVSVADYPDDYAEHPERYEEGSVVRCAVIFAAPRMVQLSMRVSSSAKSGKGKGKGKSSAGSVNDVTVGLVREDQSVEAVHSVQELSLGATVRGAVQSVVPKVGLFLALGRHLTARVMFKNLSDKFVEDVAVVFPTGKLVTGRIVSLDAEHGKVDVSLRRETADDTGMSQASLTPNKVVDGKVDKIEKYGAFIRIAGSRLVGLCHISQLSDTFVKDPNEHLKVGDKVKAIVLDVDAKTGRISLSMKPSAFEAATAEKEGGAGLEAGEKGKKKRKEKEAGAGTEGGEKKKKRKEAVREEKSKGEEEEQEEEESAIGEDEEDAADEALKKMLAGLQWEAEGDGTSDADEVMEDAEGVEEEEPGVPELDVPAAFDWAAPTSSKQAAAAAKAKKARLATRTEDYVEDDSDEEGGGSDEDEGDESGKSRTKKKKRTRKQLEEEEERLREREAALLNESHPTSADDYERLIMAQPNSSYIWIAFIAHYLSRSEIDNARAVGERALRTINFRDDQEKMNVCVALMNLEHTYGTPGTLQDMFRRAAQICDPKKMHLQLLRIYHTAKDQQKAEELYGVMCRTFKSSAKVWVSLLTFHLRSGRPDQARAALQRALQSLPKRKHVSVITKFAQLEYRYGSPERARTIFDGVLRNYPKRIDLWNIYLDMQLNTPQHHLTRALFERVCALNLSSKKMKYFLKRYLEFEKSHGSEQTVEHVREVARQYVQSKLR